MDEHWLLRLIVTHSSKELVLIYKSELSSRGIHLHLVYHHVRDLGVLNHRYPGANEANHHEGQHGWVAHVEWIFSDQVNQYCHGNEELRVQLEHAPPLGPVIVQQVVAALQLVEALLVRRVDVFSERGWSEGEVRKYCDGRME